MGQVKKAFEQRLREALAMRELELRGEIIIFPLFVRGEDDTIGIFTSADDEEITMIEFGKEGISGQIADAILDAGLEERTIRIEL